LRGTDSPIPLRPTRKREEKTSRQKRRKKGVGLEQQYLRLGGGGDTDIGRETRGNYKSSQPEEEISQQLDALVV